MLGTMLESISAASMALMESALISLGLSDYHVSEQQHSNRHKKAVGCLKLCLDSFFHPLPPSPIPCLSAHSTPVLTNSHPFLFKVRIIWNEKNFLKQLKPPRHEPTDKTGQNQLICQNSMPCMFIIYNSWFSTILCNSSFWEFISTFVLPAT